MKPILIDYSQFRSGTNYKLLNDTYKKLERKFLMISSLIPDEFEKLRSSKYVYKNVEKIVLENTENKHYKYYHLSQKKRDVENDSKWCGSIYTAAWGRIGAKPQHKEYNSKNDTIYDKMIAKLKKGYKIKTYKQFSEHSAAYDDFMELVGEENTELFD